MFVGPGVGGPVLPDASRSAGSDREGLAVVRPQIHRSVRLPARRPEGDVARFHAADRLHLAVDESSSGRLPVQRAVPAAPARPRVLVSVRHVRRQLRKGSTRSQGNHGNVASWNHNPLSSLTHFSGEKLQMKSCFQQNLRRISNISTRSSSIFLRKRLTSKISFNVRDTVGLVTCSCRTGPTRCGVRWRRVWTSSWTRCTARTRIRTCWPPTWRRPTSTFGVACTVASRAASTRVNRWPMSYWPHGTTRPPWNFTSVISRNGLLHSRCATSRLQTCVPWRRGIYVLIYCSIFLN